MGIFPGLAQSKGRKFLLSISLTRSPDPGPPCALCPSPSCEVLKLGNRKPLPLCLDHFKLLRRRLNSESYRLRSLRWGPGEPITTLDQFTTLCGSKNNYQFWDACSQRSASGFFFLGLPVRTILNYLKEGWIRERKLELGPDYKPKAPKS